MKLYIVGAVPKIFGEIRKEGTVLDRGQVAMVDLERGSYETLLDYKSSEYLAQPGFRSASYAENGDLLLVTGNEVVRFCPKKRAVLQKISCRYFNDLHHVVESKGFYYVVSTGFDAVVKLDASGAVIEILNASFNEAFHRYDEDMDLRGFDSLKPHESHVNHVRIEGTNVWVTRFNSRDCVNLKNSDDIYLLNGEGCHDGLEIDGNLYFTSVDGKIKIQSLEKSNKLTEIDLYDGDRENAEPLGWCRGVDISSDIAYVGFTQLRTTKITSNLRWVRNMIKNKKIEKKPAPTSIVSYSLKEGRVVDKYELPDNGIGALFSVLVVK